MLDMKAMPKSVFLLKGFFELRRSEAVDTRIGKAVACVLVLRSIGLGLSQGEEKSSYQHACSYPSPFKPFPLLPMLSTAQCMPMTPNRLRLHRRRGCRHCSRSKHACKRHCCRWHRLRDTRPAVG